ncbi:MAG: D-aminoacylase [Deltaproteobacteria bacterium]|nr:D-aminoacylase [Deltaproteobacteria bacterium]
MKNGSPRLDLLIRNARIVDGTGAPSFTGSVGVRGDRIVAIEPSDVEAEATATLDVDGRVLSPGFIDVHSHDDFAVVFEPEMGFKVEQGVTSEIVGNCGIGAAPHECARGFSNAIFPGHQLPPWNGFAGYLDYLDYLDENPPSLNVGTLAGHGVLRQAAMENPRGAPSAGELSRLRDSLRCALEEGAVGYSSGLIYDPSRWATTEELVALAREMSRTGGLYATHMRDESRLLLDSVAEAIRVGSEGGVPVQISHHKASGRASWGLVHDSLRLIEEARAQGGDVTADQYPYTAGSTILSAVLGWLTGESDEGLRMEPCDVVIASNPDDPSLEGLSIADIARQWEIAPADVARRIVEQGQLRVWVVLHTMCEDDVQTVLRHPTTMIGSDGIQTPAGKPHPRLYGTFPRVLGRYARDLAILSLEEAVRRMTSFPAEKFGLRDRGTIRVGAHADLVVFDPETIADTATWTDPRRAPEGIRHVFVNETSVVRDGAHTGARPGRSLRGPVR